MMQNICVPGADFLLPTMNPLVRKKSVRIAKAGDYLKPMMVQCALAAIKSKSSLILQSNMVESKSDVDTKGNHCHCKNDDGLYLPHGFRKEALYPY